MLRIKTISIPEPCHQSWQQMEITDGGRHCAHCCKTVVDFSGMTNEEIIVFLSSATNVCGRFYDGQLVQLNNSLNLPKSRKIWKPFRLVAAITLLFSMIKAEAQVRKPTTIHNARSIKVRKTESVKPDSIICTELTADKIIINTKNTTNDSMVAKIPQTTFSLSGTLGGVIVLRTPVPNAYNRLYLSLLDFLRY